MSRDDVETKEVAEATERPASAPDEREVDRQLSRTLRLGLPMATVVGAVAAGALQGPSAVVLVLCAGALVSVIALFWASLRTLVGETALSGADAYALGAPRAEEERKRAVLRALKDLEFERSVGKISDEDYRALVAKYRAEGKRLIQALEAEAEPRRRKVEDLVAARLFQEGLAEAPPEPFRGAAAEVKAPKKKGKAAKAEPAAPATKVDEETKPSCASCGTRNDADATFCKKCGARLAEGDAQEQPSLEKNS
jgi:hypothetical protein